MADFMFCLGTYCSVNPNNGRVIGKLKRRPEDFIVNEINKDRNIASIDSNLPVPKKPSTVTAVPVTSPSQPSPSQPSPSQPSPSQPSPSQPSLIVHPRPSSLPTEDHVAMVTPIYIIPAPIANIPSVNITKSLTELLSDDVIDNIKALCRKWEESMNIRDCTEVNIGSFGCKTARANVHLAVRREFPSLKTVTKKSIEANSEIIVIPDSAYSLLMPLIGSQESKDFLIFINITERCHNSLYYFPPDNSKAHRTEVHRTIDKLYGHLVETKSFTEPHPLHTSEPHPPPTSEPHLPPTSEPHLPPTSEPHLPPAKRRKNDSAGEDGGSRRTEERETERGGTRICVRFRKKAYSGIKTKVTGQRNDWYVKFALKKENMETLDAINKLSKMLSCQPSQFSFAGMKDRRAVTTQLMAVKNITADRLPQLSHPLLQCGNFEYVTHPLRLGDLYGNQFQLRITEVGHERDNDKETIERTIEDCMSSLRTNGFINYYGPQRFGVLTKEEGSTVIISAAVGLAMLQQDPVKAVNLILQPECPDTSCVNEAKHYYTNTGDIAGTLSRLPENRTREILILKALKRHGKTEYGCQRALLNIPYQMRLLYIHSFTSLIWNHLVSYRIQQYGNRPIKGDLIMNSSADTICVIPLTDNDIELNKYTLHDIVLPLVGNNIVIPENDIGKKLVDLVSSVNLTMSSFKLLRQYGLSVPGAYRPIISYPQSLTWILTNNTTTSTVLPSDCEQDNVTNTTTVLPSDYDIVTSTTESTVLPSDYDIVTSTTESTLVLPSDCEQDMLLLTEQDNATISHKGLLSTKGVSTTTTNTTGATDIEMCFILESSCYATSMLRELLSKK